MLTSKVSRSFEIAATRLSGLAHQQLMRSTALVFATNSITALGGMVFWFLAARTQATEIVGVATAGTTMMILLSGISQMGLGFGLIRYYSVLGADRARRLMVIFAFVAIIAAVIALSFWQLSPLIAAGLSTVFDRPAAVLLFVMACVGWTVSIQYDNYLMGRRLMGLLAIKSILLATLRIGLIVTLTHPTVSMIIAMTGLSGLFSMVAVMPWALRYPSPLSSVSAPVTSRALITYSFWNYLSGLAGTLPSLVIPTIAVGVLGGAQAAAYYMAWTLFSALQFVPSALSWVLFAEHSATGHSTVHGKATQQRVDIGMAMLSVAFIPAALIVLKLMGTTYIDYGWTPLLVLVAGFWPYYRVLVLTAELRVSGVQSMLTVAHTASHVAIVIASIPLLTYSGTSGAALAWSSGQCVLVISLEWLVRFSRRRAISS